MDTPNVDPTRQSRDIDSKNTQSLMRVGLMVALTLLFSSSTEPTLIPAVFSSMALMSAAIVGAFAVFMREPVHAPHLTRWDEAAALLGLSLLTGLFTDPAVVRDALQQAAPAVANG